jgi:hypothetical protein
VEFGFSDWFMALKTIDLIENSPIIDEDEEKSIKIWKQTR